jgi:hypothetical protein
MKTYRLIANKGTANILFTVEDLIPIRHQRRYSYMDLVRLIDYSEYKFSSDSFDEDYHILYQKAENREVDFFKIKGTNVIVIPGNHIYPTTLSESDIE